MHGNLRLVDLNPDSGALRQFVQRSGDATASWIAKYMDRTARRQHRRDQTAERRAIADKGRFELQALPLGHDRQTMVTDRPAEDDHITRAGAPGRDIHALGDETHARRIDEHAVTAAPLDDLGISRDDAHAHFSRRGRLGSDDAFQIIERETFLDNIAGGEPQGLGAAHRQIVHRAADGELANVPAGKEERLHDERVRGESHADGRSIRQPDQGSILHAQ